MRPFTAAELLDLWDHGTRQLPVQRALALLATACSESVQTIAGLPIGQRDAQLLTLREWTFGPRLACLVACPACGERLEMALRIEDLRAATPEMRAAPFTLAIDEYALTYRLPTSADVLALTDDAADPRGLVARCVIEARHSGAALAIELLPERVITALGDAMAEHDPQADLQLALTCPACSHAWQALFDIVAFFWREIEAWAARTLHEIHTLASAYGWRESEILALSPQRRRRYLELVSA